MECRQHTHLFEDAPRFPIDVARFEFAAGAVQQDDRTRRFGGGDFLSHLPAFTHVMQNDAKTEFLLQPQHRQNVVVTMRMMMDNAFAIQNFHKRFEQEITRGHLFRIALGARDFVPVLLGGDVLLTDERGGFSARARERRIAAGIGSIGHLQTARDAAILVRDHQVFDRVAIAQFQINRLAADQMPGAGHDIDGRDAARLRALNARTARVDRIQDAYIRLNRAGLIRTAVGLNVTMCVHHPRQDDFASEIAQFGAGWNCGVRWPDDHDLPALHDEYSIFNRRAANGDNRRAFERQRFVLSVSDKANEKRCQHKQMRRQ